MADVADAVPQAADAGQESMVLEANAGSAAAAGRERSRTPPRAQADHQEADVSEEVPGGHERGLKDSDDIGVRERSRSPPHVQSQEPQEPMEEVESDNWAARWREAMSRKLGWAAHIDGETPSNLAEDAGDAAEVEVGQAVEPTTEEHAVRAQPSPFPYLGCEKGFQTEEQFRKHIHANAIIISEPFQAVVEAMSCMPGAGNRLWCPACSEDDVRGQWSGPARKAPALLRHLSAAAASNGPSEASHRRLQRALVELLLVDLPTDVEPGALQEWAATSRLLAAVGPLLAKPSAAARTAIQKLQDEILGSDPTSAGAALAPDGSADTKTVDDDDGEPEPGTDSDQKKLRILGLDLTLDDTVGSGLYDDVVPLNAVPGAADAEAADGEVEVEDAGPGLGCALPAGGIAGLTSFDLTLSSSEDEAPAAPPSLAPAATAPLKTADAAAGTNAAAAAGTAAPASEADDEDDDNLEFI